MRSQTFTYDPFGNTTSTSDDRSLRFDRSLGTITNSATHPNQLQSAAGVVAKYDAAGNLADLTVTRAGTCDKGKCAQRFAYDWDEVGQLVRARRWDYSGNTIPAGEPVYPALPTRAADRDLHYAYAMGARVLKSTTTETGAELHSLEVFDSLRVEGAQFLVDDYELNENTERVYLAGLGRLVYDATLPSWSGDPKHVLLTIADRLGSAAFVLDKDSGELVEKITRQAYGEVESDYRPARWKSQREVYGFTGKEDDIEVGLTYFGARYFHTRLGRWASPDPLTIHTRGADPNPYGYVGGRTTTAIDPFGLDGENEGGDSEPCPVDDCVTVYGTRTPPSPEVAVDAGTILPDPPVPQAASYAVDPERAAGELASMESTARSSAIKNAALDGVKEGLALLMPGPMLTFGRILASDDMNLQKAAHPDEFNNPGKGLLMTVEFLAAVGGLPQVQLRLPTLPRSMNATESGRYSGRYANGQRAYRTNVPRDPKTDVPSPDPEAKGAHSRLQFDAKASARVYSATEFDKDGNPVRRIDFAGRTGDLIPHQHKYDEAIRSFAREKEPLE